VVHRGPQTILQFDSEAYGIDSAAPTVTVVDTTGAGDCFCGVLAASLAQGHDLAAAVPRAVAAASLAVTRVGAALSMPYASESN
jgi:ribokinase